MSATTHKSASSTIVRDPRWAAVIARDGRMDGRFFYAVKTTGVYCRPSCPSRRPRLENVQFHTTREAAEQAGFRPCKRCRPDQPPVHARHAEIVTDICRFIESSDTPPKLEQLARRAGMSPYYFHRVFKSITGLTPKDYANSCRHRRVRGQLERSASITTTMFAAGYNASSRFYEKSR